MSRTRISNFVLRASDFHRKAAGFTMVEVVVMMSIITIISGIVLVSFTGLHEGAALNRSARELALAIRRAQNMSLAVTQIETLVGPRIPPAIGIRFEQGAGGYFVFGDFNRDNRYGGELAEDERDVRITGDAVFEGNVKIRSVAYYDAFNNRQQVQVLYVIFAAPEAAVTLADADGISLGDLAEIELVTASGQLTKRIVARTSGQVSIR